MRFYVKAMRNASLILFWSAFVLFFGSILISAAIYDQQLQRTGVEIAESIETREVAWQIVSAVLSAWNLAMLPFFGAAFLWTLERKLPKGGAE
jgi:hypothetical protein